MFAEFEHIIHKKVQEGHAVTPDMLTEIYYDLNKKYFGDALVIDEEIGLEWSRIPHSTTTITYTNTQQDLVQQRLYLNKF